MKKISTRSWAISNSPQPRIKLCPAYAGQATCYNLRCLAGISLPRRAIRGLKRRWKKALELDAGLAEAHAALGYFKMAFDWDFAGAEREQFNA